MSASTSELKTPDIAAVVVTRDRLKLLQRVLEAIGRQTLPVSVIYVVDVASTDGVTAPFLRERARQEATDASPRVVVVTLNENAGGAGGFHAGMKAAHTGGHEWAWCMDDDGFPTPDSLHLLVEASKEHPHRWLNSVVVNQDKPDELAFNLPVNGEYILRTLEDVQSRGDIVDDCAPFNGTLIHREVFDAVGLPNPAFFIWGDEQEFKRRSKAGGFPSVTVTSSIYHHPSSNAAAAAHVPLKAFWKHYYHVRNHGASATKDGQVRLSPSGAWYLGARYIYALLRASAVNGVKILIILAALLAALTNNTKRYYP
jgi:GT2 family glycosyltransferase